MISPPNADCGLMEVQTLTFEPPARHQFGTSAKAAQARLHADSSAIFGQSLTAWSAGALAAALAFSFLLIPTPDRLRVRELSCPAGWDARPETSCSARSQSLNAEPSVHPPMTQSSRARSSIRFR